MSVEFTERLRGDELNTRDSVASITASVLHFLATRSMRGRRRIGIACYLSAVAAFIIATYLYTPWRTDTLDALAQKIGFDRHYSPGVCALFGLGFLMIELGRRLRVPNGESIAEHDQGFVLYLRPFSADKLRDAPLPLPLELQALHPMAFFPPDRHESTIVHSLRRIAPVLAIQHPGEVLPATGAIPIPVPDYWRPKVEDLIRRARLVFLVAGGSPGVCWELETALKSLRPQQLVVFLGLRTHWKDPADRARFLELLPVGRSTSSRESVSCIFVRFDDGWEPKFIGPKSEQSWADSTFLSERMIDLALAHLPVRDSRKPWQRMRVHRVGVLYVGLLWVLGAAHFLIVSHNERGHPWARQLPAPSMVTALSIPDIDKELSAAKLDWESRKRFCDEELAALERGEFYTQGSTKKAVILIQGPPDHKETDWVWSYGAGEVKFMGDVVWSWSDNLFFAAPEVLERVPRLKAKDLECEASMVSGYETQLDYLDHDFVSRFLAGLITARLEQGFGLGSTKFNVEMSQGLPDHEDRSAACSRLPSCDVSLAYGQSEVFISHDRVISWRDPAKQLKITKPELK